MTLEKGREKENTTDNQCLISFKPVSFFFSKAN